MVVILQPGDNDGTDGLKTQDLLIRALRGYFQALMLIFLTFLFGSTYSGDLLATGIFLVSFITVIVISRTYSIYFCKWMERALGVTT